MSLEPLELEKTSSTRVDMANGVDDLDDAHHAIDYFGQWIRGADTKAGLLAASVAVIIGTGSAKITTSTNALQPPTDLSALTRVLVGLTIVAVSISVAALAVAVVPRTTPSEIPSRFSFPTVASPDWTFVPATRDEASVQAWTQARVLARIAQNKHGALRVASVTTFSSMFLYISSFITFLLRS